MANVGYTTLTRQSGLMREMQSIAHNLANLSTTGYRGDGVVFAEHVKRLGDEGSLSMATANVRKINLQQGALTKTGGAYDFAIEGDGFFMVQTPQGERLTRAGAFTPNEAGELATPDGHLLLDAGGAPIFIPPDAASISLASDGTLSADGRALGLVGLYRPADPATLTRQTGVLFATTGDIEPVDGATILQGFTESSNVEPVFEIARMTEVQHAYELGQSFLDRENERIREAIRLMGQ